MTAQILREGIESSSVTHLQQMLAARGFSPGKADGIFGRQTKLSLVRFQRKAKLVADGICGPKTWAALGTPKPQLVVGQRPEAPLSTPAEIKAKFQLGTPELHEACYKIVEFLPDQSIRTRISLEAKVMLTRKVSLYTPLEQKTGIPWAMSAVIHHMECSNNPKGTLHNGQLIIGTGKKTTIVPRGRGPFQTWLEGALDAVDSLSLFKVPNWSVGYILRQCERFNGLGYAKRGLFTPYDYACTNIAARNGKFLSDGKFSSWASTTTQVGCAALLRQLELWGEWKPTYASDHEAPITKA